MLLSCFNIFVFVCVNFYVAYMENIGFDAEMKCKLDQYRKADYIYIV